VNILDWMGQHLKDEMLRDTHATRRGPAEGLSQPGRAGAGLAELSKQED